MTVDEKNRTPNDFDKLLCVVAKQARDAGVPISSKIKRHVEVNTRAKKRFGSCKYLDGIYTIELSEVLLYASEHHCRQTIAHELIHTCKGCDNHGKLFLYYADILNKRYGYDIKRTHTPEEMGLTPEQTERKVNYILQCQKCGAQIKRTRYSNVVAHPSRYLCSCGGRLKRIK